MTRSVRVLPQNPDVVINPALSDLAQPLRPPPENSKKDLLPDGIHVLRPNAAISILVP